MSVDFLFWGTVQEAERKAVHTITHLHENLNVVKSTSRIISPLIHMIYNVKASKGCHSMSFFLGHV